MGLMSIVGKVVKFAEDHAVRRASRTFLLERRRSIRSIAAPAPALVSPARSEPSSASSPPPPPRSPPPPQDYFHYAMIPAIIIVGMHTTPRPGLAALLTPV